MSKHNFTGNRPEDFCLECGQDYNAYTAREDCKGAPNYVHALAITLLIITIVVAVSVTVLGSH